jgi:hypothetical protein
MITYIYSMQEAITHAGSSQTASNRPIVGHFLI